MAAGAAALLASACTPDGKGVLVQSCVKDGQDQKTCDCIATAMQKNMDPQLFQAAVLQAQGKNDEAEKVAKAVSADKAMESASKAMAPMLQCAMGGKT